MDWGIWRPVKTLRDDYGRFRKNLYYSVGPKVMKNRTLEFVAKMLYK